MKGYRREAGRRNGGVTKIALVNTGAVRSVRYDRSTGNAESIELAEGESFALYLFMEDSASFTERTVIDAGAVKFERELSFTLERLDGNQRDSITELMRRSAEGFVAVVFNGSGTAHLMGLSRDLDDRFPLRVKSLETSTGTSPTDLSGDIVTLYNEDTLKAPLFTGDLTLNDENS